MTLNKIKDGGSTPLASAKSTYVFSIFQRPWDSVRPHRRKAYEFYIGKASNFGSIWNSIKTGPSTCRAFWNASYKSAGVSARKAGQPYASAMATALSPGRFKAAVQKVQYVHITTLSIWHWIILTTIRRILKDRKLLQNSIFFIPRYQDDHLDLLLDCCIDALDRVVQTAIPDRKDDSSVALCKRDAYSRWPSPAKTAAG
jgi:hypothetical protein